MRRNICVVAWDAAALFHPDCGARFGGAEVQAYNFARGLASLPAYDVTFVVREAGQPAEEVCDGIRVLARPHPSPKNSARRRIDRQIRSLKGQSDTPNAFGQARLKALQLQSRLYRAASRVPYFRQRINNPRPSVIRSFSRLGADAVVTFGVNNRSADVVASCQKYDICSIVSLVCDHELSLEYFHGSDFTGPFGEHAHLCHYVIANSDQLIVQTEFQKRVLAERFAREGALIKNPIDLSIRAANNGRSREPFALWIGRAETVQKRPELCLELAGQCPDIPFVMVMNPLKKGNLYHELVSAAPSNVEFIKSVPFREIEDLFAGARAYVSTSVLEGFPNVFLEAAKYRVPIVSLDVDPDGFIERNDCGAVAHGSLDALTAALRRIWTDPVWARQLGDAGRKYVEAEHAQDTQVQALASLVEQLCE